MDKIIIANWKNNPETLDQARELLEFSVSEAAKYPNVKTVICPPGKFLSQFTVYSLQFTVVLGAQDVFWSKPEEIPQEIKYVLVGHSDRRNPPAGGGDTDEIINQKLKSALAAGITPILLIGEKEKGEDRQKVLETQLSGALANCSTSDVVQMMIAYEPVWAISTKSGAEPDTPKNTLEAIKIIDDFLTGNWKLETGNYLYGGSVTEKNVADFLKHPEIGGAVIGGASLRKEEFANILKIVSKL